MCAPDLDRMSGNIVSSDSAEEEEEEEEEDEQRLGRLSVRDALLNQWVSEICIVICDAVRDSLISPDGSSRVVKPLRHDTHRYRTPVRHQRRKSPWVKTNNQQRQLHLNAPQWQTKRVKK